MQLGFGLESPIEIPHLYYKRGSANSADPRCGGIVGQKRQVEKSL